MTLRNRLLVALREGTPERAKSLKDTCSDPDRLREYFNDKMRGAISLPYTEEELANVELQIQAFPDRAEKWVREKGAAAIPGLRIGKHAERAEFFTKPEKILNFKEVSIRHLKKEEHRRFCAFILMEKLTPCVELDADRYVWLMAKL